MPKAKQKMVAVEEESDDLHGVVNPLEAKSHISSLDQVMTLIQEQVKAGDTKDLLERVMADMKATLANITPTMQLADISTVTNAIKDKCFKVLLSRSDELDQILQEILPVDEIPRASGVIQMAQTEEALTEADQRVIAELFEALEVTYDQLATACSLLGRLSRTLKPEQLIIIIKASIRPLIQLNAAAGLDITTAAGKSLELPDDQTEWVKLLITPDPEAPLLKKEKINSPTQLLAATYAFKILTKFGNGTTQRKIQESYQLKAKQLATCITGRKYLGGTDQKAMAKKCKAPDDDPEPSTSTGTWKNNT